MTICSLATISMQFVLRNIASTIVASPHAQGTRVRRNNPAFYDNSEFRPCYNGGPHAAEAMESQKRGGTTT